jgi:pimeloyl-ACP methyl ester carboxylesterase
VTLLPAGKLGIMQVSLDGIDIGYNDAGTGEVLVLVHGHPFNRSMWSPQVDRFSWDGWRVITPDLRGYGESTVVPGMTTLGVFARDIANLLDHLGIERIVLGGLSMGGQIVMDFYRQFPDRVRGLLLADTFAAGETEEGRRRRNAIADRLLREGMAAYADEELPKMVAPHNIEALPAVAEQVLTMMRTTPAEGAAAALRGRAERPDYVELLSKITVPTLVVVSREDTYTPVSDAELLHEHTPDSRLVIIEGAAHMPNLERESEFNEALGAFLAGLSG